MVESCLAIQMSYENKDFMCFLLSNKALTRDVLNRKGREGIGRCYLCQNDNETNLHIVIDCDYTRKVWFAIESKLKKQELWNGDSVESFPKKWVSNDDLRDLRSLPLIVSWGIWLARNQIFF